MFFGETSPGYHILAEELERLRAEDMLLIIGTSLRVIPVDMLVPSWGAGDELVWQVNPELVDQRYYGRNVRATVADAWRSSSRCFCSSCQADTLVHTRGVFMPPGKIECH